MARQHQDDGCGCTWGEGVAASKRFIRRFGVLQVVSFDALCIAIREQFRFPLDRLKISSALDRPIKKANEAYAEFAHRLSTIFATMNDGEETTQLQKTRFPCSSRMRDHRSVLLDLVHPNAVGLSLARNGRVREVPRKKLLTMMGLDNCPARLSFLCEIKREK